MRHCKAKGLSICHITEALWLGYLYGWNEKLDIDVQSPTINLTVVRDVKRVRRYARFNDVVEVDEAVRVVPKPKCELCGRESVVARFRTKLSGIEKWACSRCAVELRGHQKWLEVSGDTIASGEGGSLK